MLDPTPLKSTLVLGFTVLLLTGCSFFEPHKVLISQGSWVDEKKIDQLEIGMTKEQVDYLLGTALIIDSFVRNRWIYLYNDRLDTRVLRERRLQLDFEGGSLVRIEKTLPKKVSAENEGTKNNKTEVQQENERENTVESEAT